MLFAPEIVIVGDGLTVSVCKIEPVAQFVPPIIATE